MHKKPLYGCALSYFFFVLLFFPSYRHTHFAKIAVYVRKRLILFSENNLLGLGRAGKPQLLPVGLSDGDRSV